MEDTLHFRHMLQERGIEPEWADRVLAQPDRTEDHDDGTRHFIKRIPECDGRWLRVVVNIRTSPQRRVTAFFDRRLREDE